MSNAIFQQDVGTFLADMDARVRQMQSCLPGTSNIGSTSSSGGTTQFVDGTTQGDLSGTPSLPLVLYRPQPVLLIAQYYGQIFNSNTGGGTSVTAVNVKIHVHGATTGDQFSYVGCAQGLGSTWSSPSWGGSPIIDFYILQPDTYTLTMYGKSAQISGTSGSPNAYTQLVTYACQILAFSLSG